MMLKRIEEEIHNTMEIIAPDLEDSLEISMQGPITPEHLAECAADLMDTYCKDKEVLKEYFDLDYDKRRVLLLQVAKELV